MRRRETCLRRERQPAMMDGASAARQKESPERDSWSPLLSLRQPATSRSRTWIPMDGHPSLPGDLLLVLVA